MTDLERARTDPEGSLWAELEALNAGMLGIAGSGQHMQPMAHHADPSGRRLWFLTTRDTDLAKALKADSTAHYTIVSKAQDYYACMSGPITEDEDKSMLDALWTPAVSKLFAEDKNDPDLMMISLELTDAAIWALAEGTSHFAWDERSTQDPDDIDVMGVRNHVNFD